MIRTGYIFHISLPKESITRSLTRTICESISVGIALVDHNMPGARVAITSDLLISISMNTLVCFTLRPSHVQISKCDIAISTVKESKVHTPD